MYLILRARRKMMRMQSMGPRYSLVTILQSLRFKLRLLNRAQLNINNSAIYLPNNWEVSLIVV